MLERFQAVEENCAKHEIIDLSQKIKNTLITHQNNFKRNWLLISKYKLFFWFPVLKFPKLQNNW